MPTTPRPKQRVPTELLKPIDGIPEKMNDFLIALAASITGEVQPAATVLGTSTTQITRWREKSPEFDERVTSIQEELKATLVDELEQRILDIARNKRRKRTEKRNGDDEIIHVLITEEDDVNAILIALQALRPDKYVKGQQKEISDMPLEWSFKLGNEPQGELEAGPEAGEIIDEDPPED